MLSSSSQSSYFSFPSYESHFMPTVASKPSPSKPISLISKVQSTKPLESHADCSAKARAIIERNWYLEAEVQLIVHLIELQRRDATVDSDSVSQSSGSSGSSSYCTSELSRSSHFRSRSSSSSSSVIQSIKNWYRFV